MMKMNEQDPSIDPGLRAKLDELRSTPARDPNAAALGRARFIAELDALLSAQLAKPAKAPSRPWLDWYGRLRQAYKEKLFMATRTQRLAFTAGISLILIFVFLFGGAGMTAYAAQSALPGDALYPVKTQLEQARASMARDAAERAHLNLQFAQLRLDEMAALIAEGRFNDISQATDEFQFYVQRAISNLETVAAGDPAGASVLAGEVTQALSRYAEVLSQMKEGVPAAAQVEMERAINASQGGSTQVGAGKNGETEFAGVVTEIGEAQWTIGGRIVSIEERTEIKGAVAVGDTVKVHILVNPDGTLTAREIEPASLAPGDNDNANVNGNENVNLNENANSNSNDNSAGDNTNLNSNEAENENESEVENHNGGEDDNLNDNTSDEDNSNTNANNNDNGNDAGDDHDGNSNDNGNSNDAGDDHDGNDNGGDDNDDNGNGNDNGDDDDGDDGDDPGGNGNDHSNDDDGGGDSGNDNGGGEDDGGDHDGNDNSSSDDHGGNGGNDNGIDP